MVLRKALPVGREEREMPPPRKGPLATKKRENKKLKSKAMHTSLQKNYSHTHTHTRKNVYIHTHSQKML